MGALKSPPDTAGGSREVVTHVLLVTGKQWDRFTAKLLQAVIKGTHPDHIGSEATLRTDPLKCRGGRLAPDLRDWNSLKHRFLSGPLLYPPGQGKWINTASWKTLKRGFGAFY